MDKREAASIVAIIAAAYPQWPASRETVAVYAETLADLDHRDVSEAVREIILTDDRWPTVATIRRRTAARAGILSPSPSEAWAEVRTLTAAGHRGTLVDLFSHPAIAETVSTIGWWDLCHSTNPETIRAQFLRLYTEARDRHDTDLVGTPGRIALDARGRDRLGSGGPMAATLPPGNVTPSPRSFEGSPPSTRRHPVDFCSDTSATPGNIPRE